jgi:hypothetical protein
VVCVSLGPTLLLLSGFRPPDPSLIWACFCFAMLFKCTCTISNTLYRYAIYNGRLWLEKQSERKGSNKLAAWLALLQEDATRLLGKVFLTVHHSRRVFSLYLDQNRNHLVARASDRSQKVASGPAGVIWFQDATKSPTCYPC